MLDVVAGGVTVTHALFEQVAAGAQDLLDAAQPGERVGRTPNGGLSSAWFALRRRLPSPSQHVGDRAHLNAAIEPPAAVPNLRASSFTHSLRGNQSTAVRNVP